VDMKFILRMLLYFANTGQEFMVNLLTLRKMSALSITTTGITINNITTTADYCVTVNICTKTPLSINFPETRRGINAPARASPARRFISERASVLFMRP
jgi:hypothetical protein